MNIVPFKERSHLLEQSTETYRSYLLTCTQDKNLCIGEAFKQNIRIAYCEGASLDATQQRIRTLVDRHIKDEIKLRSNEEPDFELWYMSTMQILFNATRQEKDVLHKLSQSQECFVNITELANHAMLSNTAKVNYLLSEFARKICDFIPYEPPYPANGRDPYLALVCESSQMNDSVCLSTVFRTILKNYRPYEKPQSLK